MSLLYGAVVGLALGLTGGGGSIFAVPLLVFGLDLPLQTAIGISLAVVGAAACFGAVRHWRRRELDLRAGLVFAAGGMALAPLGTWIGRSVPGPWLLTGFALLMSSMAWRLWTGRGEEGADPGACAVRPGGGLGAGCYVRLTAGGAAAGLLSGLFGVGGGFIIVHGLMYVAGMALHRAVATSLMVIFLISLSGVASHMVHGLQFPPILTGLFLSGSLLGMIAGQGLRARLSGPTLRRVFAGAMWAVAALLLFRSLPNLGRAETSVEDAPIVLSNPLCLQCHGTPGRELKEEDAERIRQLYPEDRATGFGPGDLRGMWRVDFPATPPFRETP